MCRPRIEAEAADGTRRVACYFTGCERSPGVQPRRRGCGATAIPGADAEGVDPRLGFLALRTRHTRLRLRVLPTNSQRVGKLRSGICRQRHDQPRGGLFPREYVRTAQQAHVGNFAGRKAPATDRHRSTVAGTTEQHGIEHAGLGRKADVGGGIPRGRSPRWKWPPLTCVGPSPKTFQGRVP